MKKIEAQIRDANERVDKVNRVHIRLTFLLFAYLAAAAHKGEREVEGGVE